MKDMYEKKYEVRGRGLIYRMPKELDHHVAQQLCKELDMLIETLSIQELELDFLETEFMDSSGIGVTGPIHGWRPSSFLSMAARTENWGHLCGICLSGIPCPLMSLKGC